MLQSALHLRTAQAGMTLIALAALGLTGHPAQAQVQAVNYTFDELGNGNALSLGNTFPSPGVLAPDPGPGGLASALTYNLLGPPALVVGDLFITDGGAISDVVRFNAANPLTGYPASLVFYSTKGSGTLADTGFPTAFYTVAATAPEILGVANYTPTSSQPGYVAGFAVSYKLISDAPVPEASTTVSFGLLLALGMGALVVASRRKKAGSAL